MRFHKPETWALPWGSETDEARRVPLHAQGGHTSAGGGLAVQLTLVPWGISRLLDLPKEGGDWVERETCPSTKLPARSLMFSFSFCFRGQRGLMPLKQTENEDRGEPALPTAKRDQSEEKAQLGRESKGESANGL